MTEIYRCDFCQREFRKEQSLQVHVCEQKRRRGEEHERGVQLGLQAFNRFYQVTQGTNRVRTFENFAQSNYYRAFVKFGRYCVDTHVIRPELFMDWLLAKNRRIDHWCRDSAYTDYLLDRVGQETAEESLTRAQDAADRWAESTGHPARDFLRFGNSNAICHAITSARVTGWVLYNCDSGVEFLGNLNSEQIAMVWPWIDTDVWHRQFDRSPADTLWVRQRMKELGW